MVEEFVIEEAQIKAAWNILIDFETLFKLGEAHFAFAVIGNNS